MKKEPLALLGFLSIFAALAGASCGSSSGSGGGGTVNPNLNTTPGGPYSCSLTNNTCIDLTGAGYTTSLATAQNACANLSSNSGTFNNGTVCSTQSRVGSCTASTGGGVVNQVIYRYYSAGFTTSSAQATCAAIPASENPTFAAN